MSKYKSSPLQYNNAATRYCICAFTLLPIVMSLNLAYAQDGQSQTPFLLGEIDVQANKLPTNGLKNTVITQQDMLANGALTIGQALSNVPGITTTYTGQRAESQIFIRGFSPQQTTLNIDGIPIYVPYDGNVDLSRILTQGISIIEVAKGLGSLMYGPNNMGGSINIITSAPSKAFEGSLTTGITANQNKVYGQNAGLQIGSRLNSEWYIQGGLSQNNSDSFPLSGSFIPVAAQPAGDRLQARSRDTNSNLKVGFIPNATDEYALGFYSVSSSKESPPYTGKTAVTGQKVAYWDWPQWDKQSYYFIGDTAIGDGYIKTRLFRDNFNNKLSSYDNANYNTVTKPYAFLSEYNDYSTGASVELGQPVNAKNFLKVGVFYKKDFHNETYLPSLNYPNSPWLHDKATTESLGFEDAYAVSGHTKVTFGYRYDKHQFDQAQVYTNTANTTAGPMTVAPAVGANNEQITVTQDLGDKTTLRYGIGNKTRFPGIKDVYSYRLGAGIPNPVLGPEHALNREIGLSGKIFGDSSYDISLYWDSIKNAIAFVTVSPGVGQNQNVGTASNKGLDVTLQTPLAAHWELNTSYSYLSSVLGTPGLLATNAPKDSANITLRWLKSEATEVASDLQASSGRQSSTSGLQPVAGYAVANLRLVQHLDKKLTLSTGLYNLFDHNYALTEGFPMPGRTIRAQIEYKF